MFVQENMGKGRDMRLLDVQEKLVCGYKSLVKGCSDKPSPRKDSCRNVILKCTVSASALLCQS